MPIAKSDREDQINGQRKRTTENVGDRSSCALEVLWRRIRSKNARSTYLLTYLLTYTLGFEVFHLDTNH